MSHDPADPNTPLAIFRREFARLQHADGDDGEAYEGAWCAVTANIAAEGRRRAAEFTASPHWRGEPFTEEQLDQFQFLSYAMIQSARLAGDHARWEAVAAGVTCSRALAVRIEAAVEAEMARWLAGRG